MAGFSEYDRSDALGQAELARKKQIGPAEPCEEAITRIERLNPRLSAVILRLSDQAMQTAARPLPEGAFSQGPFSDQGPVERLQRHAPDHGEQGLE